MANHLVLVENVLHKMMEIYMSMTLYRAQLDGHWANIC